MNSFQLENIDYDLIAPDIHQGWIISSPELVEFARGVPFDLADVFAAGISCCICGTEYGEAYDLLTNMTDGCDSEPAELILNQVYNLMPSFLCGIAQETMKALIAEYGDCLTTYHILDEQAIMVNILGEF